MTEERGTCRHHMRTACPNCKDDEPIWDLKNNSLYCKCGQCILDTSNLTDAREMLDRWDELTEKVANTGEDGSEYKIDDKEDIHEVVKKILPKIVGIGISTHREDDHDEKISAIANFRVAYEPEHITCQNLYKSHLKERGDICVLTGIGCIDCNCMLCNMPNIEDECSFEVEREIFSQLVDMDIIKKPRGMRHDDTQ